MLDSCIRLPLFRSFHNALSRGHMFGSQAWCVLRRVVFACVLTAGVLDISRAAAQVAAPSTTESLAPIAIIRKPGHEDGVAQIAENGKKKPTKVAPHAVTAWRVRGGDGALVIVLQPAKGKVEKQYILRYYDLDSGRRRVLGRVPMNAGSLMETKAADERWSFALSGTDASNGKPFVVVGDDQAIPGLLPGASSAEFHDDTTVSYAEGGTTKTAKLGVLLGSELHGIYVPPETAQA